jgi:hypothetical protein
MKRIEILCLAYSVSTPGEAWWLDDEDLIKFAALVAEHERAECAKVCDELAEKANYDERDALECAATAIRSQA